MEFFPETKNTPANTIIFCTNNHCRHSRTKLDFKTWRLINKSSLCPVCGFHADISYREPSVYTFGCHKTKECFSIEGYSDINTLIKKWNMFAEFLKK